jgi:hypothetical protein
MGRHARQLSPAALEAAAGWHRYGSGYREIASELYRRRLIPVPIAPATVWRRLVDAGVAERQRRPAGGRERKLKRIRADALSALAR